MRNLISIPLSILLAIFSFQMPANAGAWLHGTPQNIVSGSCPYGSTYADGCTTAPHVGLEQDSAFFTTASNFNGVDVSSYRPPWNVAGVDYGVGQYTADGSLADPTNNANLPASCSYSTHVVSCSGSGSLTITGLYFNDVCLDISGTYSSVTVTNNHFNNGTNTNSTSFCFWLVNLRTSGSTALDDEFNTYTSNANLFGIAAFFEDQRSKANSASTKHWYNYATYTTGKFTIIDDCGSQDWRYNAFSGSSGWPAPLGDRSHAEIAINCVKSGGTVASYVSTFNLSYLSSTEDNTEQTACGGTTAIDYVSSGQSLGTTYTDVNTSNNVYIMDRSATLSNPGTGPPTCSGTPKTAQISSAVYLQQSTYTTLHVKQNYIFPHGAYDCFVQNTSTIGTLDMSGNINMWDNTAIANSMNSPTCNGHDS